MTVLTAETNLAAIFNCCVVQRTFREIMFLQELDNHDNIIRYVLPVFDFSAQLPWLLDAICMFVD